MLVEPWLAFVAASVVMLLIPGPTVTLVVGYAMAHGRRAALAIALGVAFGDFTAMSLSLLGLGALLASSAALFTAVKLLGAAYLVYLGWKLWNAPVRPSEMTGARSRSPFAMGVHAFAVTALNPKGIIFFVAFVPQFIDRASPYLPQVVILVATFVTLAIMNAFAYALLASGARTMLRRPPVLRAVNRIGGGILMGAGIAAVAARNSQ
ncbi:MAG: LysE family translocator [Methylobacteriaceae bacterium]|nr:LysE family translocator [Methylobacteriaceae bacterium]